MYSGLQGFDGFLVIGYLPMQGSVLPFQCLDLVTAEKRTNALGDVAAPFSFSVCISFFRPS